MDKFITDIPGRMPFLLNDIRFLDGIYQTALSSYLKMLNADNLILHGCQLIDNGDGTFSVTEGAIVINSEFYLCDAHTFTCNNINEAYFIISETYNPEGLKQFGDNSMRNTYQLRRVIAEQHSTQPSNSISVNADRLDILSRTEIQTEISNAIDALINGSPGALDTLNELAAAMGDDPNFAATITNSLATKVDKITGMGLSHNDFTNTLLAKLNGIAASANDYVHPSAHAINFITGLQTALNDKVDKITGMSLTHNDFTNTLLAKLNGIAASANNYVHPSTHPVSMIMGGASAFNRSFAGSGSVNTVARSDQISSHGAWQVPNLQSGWHFSSSNPYQSLRFRLLSNGLLEMNGFILITPEPSSSLLFTLPAGYRPLKSQSILIYSGTGNHAVVFSDGRVTESVIYGGGSGGSIFFNSIIPLD